MDLKILRRLLQDARTPFLEIARDLLVSTGTIHQRVDRMEKAGVIKGYSAVIDRQKLGYSVTALVGIHLKNARDCGAVLDSMKKFNEVIETHFTSGNYSLMAKVTAGSIQDFHLFLTEKLQALKEIQSTESFLCLDSPTFREVDPQFEIAKR